MSKKSILSGNRLYLIAGGGVAVAAVLVAVFVFGVGLDFVKPLYEPIIPLTTQQVEENNQIVFQIDDVIEDITLQENNGDLGNISPEELNEIIEEQIQNLTDSANPVDVTNQTDFSDDPPIQQIIETVVPPSLDLISKVTKIDSSGAKETVEKVTKIGTLSLFIEELSKKDYSTGFLEVELILKGEPNLFYRGTGTFDTTIDTTPILNPVTLSIDGQGNSEGLVPIKFISPSGALSDIYTISFADNFNKFPEGQVSELTMDTSLQITETEPIQCVTTPCDPIETMFGIEDAELFTMDIRRDANLIVITDQQTGEASVVYPTDSKIILTTIANNIYGYSCAIGYTSQTTTFTNVGKTTSSNPLDCLLSYSSSATYGSTGTPLPAPSTLAGTAPAPSVTGIILLDANGQLLLTKPGGTIKILDELVTRNQNYTIKTSSPDLTGKLSYGKTQETKSYTCKSTGTSIYKNTISSTSGSKSGCGFTASCDYYSHTYYLVPNGITIGATQCNFP